MCVKLKEKKLLKSTVIMLILIAWTFVVWNAELFGYILDTVIPGNHSIMSSSGWDEIFLLTIFSIWWFSPGAVIIICAIMLVYLHKKQESKFKKIIIVAILIINITYYPLFCSMDVPPDVSGWVKHLIQ